ncbi:RNase adaptor protein RapZ [Thioclava sp. SK-1]|uniref:RNase adapter RapZ n=1 Tax=Thioclava sp. SK-1 TaxID=1889770 RepID=UPI0008258BBC|nr:RNase adapter RapZ [Thioclava sp. SK-1]OCX58672.1 RNase adaptor protein RapZ [Thioclava sp. SK-1]
MTRTDRAIPQRVVLVTGPSGAGRSTVIATLEDLGYETIDNLPLSMVPRVIDGPLLQPLALGVDVRNRDFSATRLIELIDSLTRHPDVQLEVLYMDARADVLQRRYSETRRRHPLSPDDAPMEGITQEMDILAPIRARADILIDSSDMTVHDCRAEISRLFDHGDDSHMSVSVHSFSYKRGVPRGLDVMFDCRFLTNPHWVPELRPMDGRQPEVAAHIQSDPRYDEFHERVLGLIKFLLPAHVQEGKTHLAIGFGCTGGKHRSVALTESIINALAEAGWHVSKRHRELERVGRDGGPLAKTGSGA